MFESSFNLQNSCIYLSSCILLYPPVSSCILLYTHVSSCILLYPPVSSYILLYPPVSYCILLYPPDPPVSSCSLLYPCIRISPSTPCILKSPCIPISPCIPVSSCCEVDSISKLFCIPVCQLSLCQDLGLVNCICIQLHLVQSVPEHDQPRPSFIIWIYKDIHGEFRISLDIYSR